MAAVFLNDASVEVFTPPRLPHEAPRSSYVLRHHTAYRANIGTALSPLHDESALVTASTAHAQHGPHYLSVGNELKVDDSTHQLPAWCLPKKRTSTNKQWSSISELVIGHSR